MSGRYPTRRDGKMSARLRRWLPVFAVVGAAFLLAAAVYVPVRLTSTTSYCTSCHEMKLAGDSLKRSPHRNVDCLSCHVDPGVGNAITWRLQESKNIWASYLNMPVNEGMSKEVHVPSKAACTRSGCHDLSSLGTTFGNVKMNHARHVQIAGLTCIDCHKTTAHSAKGQSAVGLHGLLLHVPQRRRGPQPVQPLPRDRARSGLASTQLRPGPRPLRASQRG